MEDRLEETLATLVAAPSDSMNTVACRQIIELVRDELEPLDVYITADTEATHPWLIATTQRTKSPKVLLVAHLDVVPANDESQYELRKDEHKLYGRGAWDMKYAAAGYIELFKAKRTELSGLDIGVLFTTDEEVGGYQGAAQALREGWRTEVAIIPDYGEDWQVEEAAKGVCTTHLRSFGRSAHGSRPWEGDNALEKLIAVLHELNALYPSVERDGPTLSVNMLSSGEALTQIPDQASAWVDFRSFSMEEIRAHKILIERLCEENNMTFEHVVHGYPLLLDKDKPLVQKYLKTLEACGIKPRYRKSFGATDGRWFAEYDIPCIVTGPRGENAHGPEEWVSRRDLLTFYHIIEHYVTNNARVKALDEVLASAHTGK